MRITIRVNEPNAEPRTPKTEPRTPGDKKHPIWLIRIIIQVGQFWIDLIKNSAS